MAKFAVEPLCGLGSALEPVSAVNEGGELLSPRLDASEYQCAICCELLLDPVVGSCGHDFCKRCIDKWKSSCDRSGRKVQCPLCRQDLLSASSQSFGVCIRLRETIAKLFPDQLAARRREAELAPDVPIVTDVHNHEPTGEFQASFTLFAETYRQLSQHLLTLVGTPEAAAAGSSLQHAQQLQFLRHQANLQSSLELLQRPRPAVSTTSSSTSSGSTISVGHHGAHRQEPSTTASPRARHYSPMQQQYLQHQQQHLHQQQQQLWSALHADPSTAAAAAAMAAASAAGVREQWTTAFIQALVDNASQSQPQGAAVQGAGGAAASASAATSSSSAWQAAMHGNHSNGHGSHARSSQEQRARDNNWMCPTDLSSEADLLLMHTRLQGRLQACERLLELCGTPRESLRANQQQNTPASPSSFSQGAQQGGFGGWGSASEAMNSSTPATPRYGQPVTLSVEDWGVLQQYHAAQHQAHRQQQQMFQQQQHHAQQQYQAAAQFGPPGGSAMTLPGASYWQQQHQLQQQLIWQQQQLMAGGHLP